MTTQNPSNARAAAKRASRVTLLVLALLASPLTFAYDPNNPLGLSSGMNLVVFDNFTVPSSDVEGRVAIGGNANISSYSINTSNGLVPLYAGTGLTVGGDLAFNSGITFGNTVVGGNLAIGSGVTFGGSVEVIGNLNANNNWLSADSLAYAGTASGLNPYQIPIPVQVAPGSIQLGFDFATERARTTGLSQNFDALTTTGNALSIPGTLALNTNGSSLAVFDLNGTDVSGNLRLDNLAPNATVLINVHGQSVDFGFHSYENFAAGRVLFNLPEATQITFAGGVNASFLAPLASFNGIGGLITGQVVVANWSGPTQLNDTAFNGSINIAPVPEPETYAMLLAGLSAVLISARRRRKSKVV